MNQSPVLIRAAGVVDGRGVHAVPGVLLMEGHGVLAAGSPAAIGPLPTGATVIDLPEAVLMPGLVNVHCHLDLSHVGPVPYSGDFVSWVDLIRTSRQVEAEAVAQSVGHGAVLARAGGTAIIGDIAGVRSLAPIEALRASGLPGVSYLEVFGLGKRQGDAVAVLRQAVETTALNERGVRLGLQPHAPYSCGLDVYGAAASMGVPLATHLAETLDELRFVADGDGPLAQLIRRLGVWDDSISGSGLHPVDHLRAVLELTPCVAAHLNYVNDEHLELMADWPVTVAYCPRASAYFGHPHKGRPPHRYRQMMSTGIRVALGTDSLVCLDTPDRISVLDEMRLLHRRDGADPIDLLRMATVNGAEALGFDPRLVTLSPGPVAGVIAVDIDARRSIDPLRQVLSNEAAPRWVAGPFPVNAP